MNAANFRSPPAINAAASGCSLVAVGPGACTPFRRNQDKFGTVVKSGHTVHYGAAVGVVLDVRKGLAEVRFISGVTGKHYCKNLQVMRHLGRLKVVPQ